MAKRGRPRKNPVVDNELTKQKELLKIECSCCGRTVTEKDLWKTNSKLYAAIQHLPICKNCLNNLYDELSKKYTQQAQESLVEERNMNSQDGYIEKKVIKRICMMFDIFYSDAVFDSAMRQTSTLPLLSAYMKVINLHQYATKTYENTLDSEYIDEKDNIISSVKNYEEEISDDESEEEKSHISSKTIKFFGTGFSEDDYEFLQREYDDWTARHECKTKAQEEIIKDICYNRLSNLKAQRKGLDTKDITATFNKLMESGKLQPKQNHSDTLADNQTFGTLIDKWENTRPIPKIDPELEDVDKIGLYLDVFFKGHLAKMMGMKNGLSRLYDKFIKKYTVTKPEYEDEDDSEALFDAIFGTPSNMDKD